MLVLNEILSNIQELLGDNAQIKKFFLGKATIVINAKSIKDVVTRLVKNDSTLGLSAITGIDLDKTIGLLYHLRTSEGIVTIKTEVPKEKPLISSITNIIPGANFHEREAADLFGVIFKDHPNLKRLVLPDNWPDDLYPLRKDANLEDISKSRDTFSYKIDGSQSQDDSLVNIIVGPQHPALLEPEKFSLKVDGEIVKHVEPRIGYVHRGVEKAAEKKTYLQDVYLVERICGICNSCHASAFVESVEKILGTQVPDRGKYIRTVILELNRLHSHLLLLGHAGLEIGYETLFQYLWRDREPVMDLTELLTGNRVIASSLTIGGVRRDLKETHIPIIKKQMAYLRERMIFYKDLFENEPSIQLRTKNVGVLSTQDAIKLCVVGPVARASGVPIDVRKDDPYEAYGEIPFKLITRNDGDAYSRLMVRLEELIESINIIDYAVDNLPKGPYRIKVPRVVSAGEVVNRVEAPRGALLYYVKSNGSAYPERVKVRTPTFSNIPAFQKTAIGGNIADVPANFVSLDPCFSCTDR